MLAVPRTDELVSLDYFVQFCLHHLWILAANPVRDIFGGGGANNMAAFGRATSMVTDRDSGLSNTSFLLIFLFSLINNDEFWFI